MNLHQKVTELVGPIDPVPDTDFDEERMKNLEVLIILTDKLIGDIARVAEHQNSDLDSVRKIGRRAARFFRRRFHATGGGEMASADNRSYVKHAIAGFLALTVAPSAALAESKFLSLTYSAT